ncbi:hypothetical protein AVEN_256791-1, partial [Araneus ventricosus]
SKAVEENKGHGEKENCVINSRAIKRKELVPLSEILNMEESAKLRKEEKIKKDVHCETKATKKVPIEAEGPTVVDEIFESNSRVLVSCLEKYGLQDFISPAAMNEGP